MSPFSLQRSKDDFHESGQLSGPLRERIEQGNANVAEVCISFRLEVVLQLEVQCMNISIFALTCF